MYFRLQIPHQNHRVYMSTKCEEKLTLTRVYFPLGISLCLIEGSLQLQRNLHIVSCATAYLKTADLKRTLFKQQFLINIPGLH